jgi:hypothetical protein
MIFAAPLVAMVVAALPPLPAELVLAIEKQVKVQGVVVVIGRRSGDSVQIEELGSTGGPKADEHTLFEIDGITETITGLLLAESVRRGEVRLDEPVAELHDADLHPPSRTGAPLTLADLASHRTGFPHLSLGQSAQPYAGVDRAALARFVDDASLQDRSGAPSVLDFALLGTLLADRAATSYASLAASGCSSRSTWTIASLTPATTSTWRANARSPASWRHPGSMARLPRRVRFARAPSTCCVSPARCFPARTDRSLPTCTSRRPRWAGVSSRREPCGRWVRVTAAVRSSPSAPKDRTAVVILCNVGLGFGSGSSSLDTIGLRLLAATPAASSTP